MLLVTGELLVFSLAAFTFFILRDREERAIRADLAKEATIISQALQEISSTPLHYARSLAGLFAMSGRISHQQLVDIAWPLKTHPQALAAIVWAPRVRHSQRERFESEMRRRIVAACDHFHDVSQFSPELLAQRISSMSIDILVHLTGWTGNTRSVALGYRPAPIQVNWLGYSGTFGSRLLADYLIGDPLATPLSDQSNFAEELVLMPVCCQPNDASRRIGKARTRVAEGLPESGFVFCCFSRPLKITPQLFQCWCDLLLALPASVLWLLAANDVAKTNLVNEAGHRGIDASRLVFSSPIPPHEHLARLSLADLALDTFPFGAHTTASDALWAGLPVITLMGDTLASRVTASMLNAIGLNELVTHSIDAYRARALELANNSTLLSSIRERLELKRISSSLFDTKEFAVALEALFRSMWQRHCLDNGLCVERQHDRFRDRSCAAIVANRSY